MAWLEYNIHIRGESTYGNIIAVLVDLVQPFVDSHANLDHWHYLLEPNVCGSSTCEVRLRFEGATGILTGIRCDLTTEIEAFSRRTNLVMREDEQLGSHEGLHGNRDGHYQGAASETFGADWPHIADILQIGSESAIKILRLGRRLVTNRSLQMGQKVVGHPYYLHLPANQLIVEP